MEEIAISIRAVLFDVKGTLLYGPTTPELYAELLSMEGFSVSPDEVEDAMRRMPSELMRQYATMRTEEDESAFNARAIPALLSLLGLDDVKTALMLRLIENAYGYSAFYSLYPEVLPVLEKLRQRGLTMAVVSNWLPSLPRLLRDFEIDTYFQAAISGMATGLEKPDPRIFAEALKRIAIPAAAAIHVGDDLTEDVAGAASTGISPVWLNRTGDPSEPECLTITDLRGLLMILGD